MKLLTASLGLLAAGLVGLASTPAAAQTASKSPQAIPSWYTSSADPCPGGWRRNGRMCENTGSGEAIFPLASRRDSCPSGFASFSGRPFCIAGGDTQLTRSSRGTITKVRRNDRCPIGYFTNNEAPMTCITQYETAPSVRLKGAGACRAGEVEDWGLYCVSNYGRLTRDDAGAAGTRDWNDIYVTSDLQGPNQENVMDNSSYTPAYITIFGRVKRDGSPIGGPAASATAPSATADAPTTAQTPTNCPAPSSSSASQAGAALGGLLGGRRGNGQAGAALGGLLGAAAGQAAKPAGCP